MKRMGDEQTGLLPNGLRYSEEEIIAVYEDLLANPIEETVEAKEDVEVSSTELVSETIRRLSSEQFEVGEETAVHRVLVERLEQLANEPSGERADSGEVAKVMSEQEWQALVQTFLDAGDVTSAEQVLGLMHRLQSSPSEDCLNLVLAFHANNGDTQKADYFIKNSLSEVPTPLQRDLHIKAHLNACRTTTFPTPALHLLHSYELQNLSPPQKTYARLISHLLHAGTSIAHAHAWDLFAHMRYVAHPTPDAFLYTTMIKACSSPSSSTSSGEPERALDLWTEMTVDKRLEPTAEAYCATILACARSGRKEYVYEGFRLAKEMMDGMRDARGRARWMPGERFFGALLQGAKRIGDLGRVRWILAEMVRGSLGNREREEGGVRVGEGEGAVVRENVMVHVFHAYASYKPPFKRSMAVVVDGEGEKGVTQTEVAKGKEENEASDVVEQTQEEGGDIVPEEPEHISFAQVPPQTHGEIIQEAEALFARILADQPSPPSPSPSPSHESEDAATAVFKHVQITPRLVNAYLSVHYAHSRVDAWRELAMTLHERVGVKRNAFFYVEVLERCAGARRGVERGDAVGVAEGLWGEWVDAERAWREGKETRQLDRAMDLVRDFVNTYPPSAIRTTVERPSLLSTRTSLVGARPLVRLMSSAEVPDDTVPPLLTFTEVEALHHRLVATRREKDIKYLKWVCKSYEGALRARRDAVMRAQPAKGEEDLEAEEGKEDGA
ncbi:hypothetical protein BC629DRAFT_1571720 [Irpex lacteus]|nr:hypothetical protein BC629DRAFT_1571720 [Irpex lacteus]